MARRPHSEVTRTDHFMMGFAIRAITSVMSVRFRRTTALSGIQKKLETWLDQLRCELDEHICQEHRSVYDINAYYGAPTVELFTEDPDARAALVQMCDLIEYYYGVRLALTHARSRMGGIQPLEPPITSTARPTEPPGL